MFSANGEANVLDDYQLAMNCLAENIDDPLCHLMLMIVLTVCASAETLQVAQGERTFSTLPRRKDSGSARLGYGDADVVIPVSKVVPLGQERQRNAVHVAEMMKKIVKRSF
ncbi:hypothetical protein COL940_014113 [Colletotrichum noveboracense]|nr:hypothetical protein COL940_014113 [Colletotrichum noveboracense]